MQTVRILLEENAYGAVRPMEVAADAPVAALVPAIVEELKLPRTDLFGNKLVYMLRYPSGGPALPDDRSLMAVGVGVGAKLALDSYVMDGSVAILMQGKERPQSSFYASETIADGAYFPALGNNTPAALPAFRQKQTKSKSRWTRRAFLALGGAAFAAGSLGFGYAAYRRFVADSIAMPAAMDAPMKLAQATTTQPVIPTAAKSVLVFEQHQRTVRSVTWSPGGTMLASGANDAQLLTWDLNGTVHVRRPQANAVRAVAWSPDGQQLAAAVANLVMFFNPVTGAALATPAQEHTDQVTALAWSPRQPLQVVSTGLDKRAIVWVWDATTYMPQTVFTQHTTAVESASWAADGQTVATCSHGGAVRVWHAGNGQQTHSAFMDAQLPMRALSFASSGLLAVGGDDGIVRLWNGLVCQQQAGNQCMDVPRHLEAHMGVVRALAWSPDARLLATGGDDGTLAIWYPAQQAQTPTPLLRVHQDAPVLALAWSSSGKQIATASGNTVTIWELY